MRITPPPPPPPPPPAPAPDFGNLSDGSELTGDEQLLGNDGEMEDDEQVTVMRTPSKNRRRVLRDEEEEDEGEMMEQVEGGVDEDAEGEDDDGEMEDDDEDADEMQDEESDDEFRDELADEDDAPSAITKGTARSRAAAARNTTASSASAATTSTPVRKGTSLKVTLRRSPSSARKAAAASTPASKGGKVSAPSSSRSKATPKGKANLSAAADASSSSASKPKSITRIKWKARPSRGGKDDDEEEDEDDPDLDGSASPSLSALDAGEDGEPMSGTDDGVDELDAAVGGGGASRAALDSPMIAKTARQLAKGNKDLEAGLLELPMTDKSKKRKLTENELALRRSETARKRKNQSEKKLEDDKIETINRLLKKQVGRSRSKLPRAGSAGGESDGDDDDTATPGRQDGPMTRKAIKELPAPFFRYVNGLNESVLGVPTAPLSVATLYPTYTVTAQCALIQEIEEVITNPHPTTSLDEKTKMYEEKRALRLQAAKATLEEEELEDVWGQEGAYEFRLRSCMGLSRKAWIGDRARPIEEEKQQQDGEEEQEADANKLDEDTNRADDIEDKADTTKDAEPVTEEKEDRNEKQHKDVEMEQA